MENSPTGESTVAPASNEPTGEAIVDNTAEQTQETSSREESQGSVSDDTAVTQTQQTVSGEDQTDDGLAKFAKSQGFDPENMTDGERRALKIAHDNQKAFRSKDEGKKIADATEALTDGSLEAEVAQLKYERTTDKFFSEGSRDRALEPDMVDILNERAEKYGKEYAFGLSRDLDALYALAQVKRGDGTVNAEAIRREERESIKKQQTASAGNAHAVTPNVGETKIDRSWIETTYDSSNPEHRKLVDRAVQNGDL